MAAGQSLFGDLIAVCFCLASPYCSQHGYAENSSDAGSLDQSSSPCRPFLMASAFHVGRSIEVASFACWLVLTVDAWLIVRMAFLAQLRTVRIQGKSVLTFVYIAGPVYNFVAAAFLAYFVVLVVWILC